MDVATKTGWCYDPGPGQKLEYGSFTISTYLYGDGEILLQFARQFSELYKRFDPKYVFIEAPFIGNFKRGKGKKGITQNMNVAKVLIRATGIAHMYAASKGIPSGNIKEVGNQSLKKFMCGSTKIGKDDMIFACRNKGYAPRCDNEADAIGIAHMAHSEVYKRELIFVSNGEVKK